MSKDPNKYVEGGGHLRSTRVREKPGLSFKNWEWCGIDDLDEFISKIVITVIESTFKYAPPTASLSCVNWRILKERMQPKDDVNIYVGLQLTENMDDAVYWRLRLSAMIDEYIGLNDTEDGIDNPDRVRQLVNGLRKQADRLERRIR